MRKNRSENRIIFEILQLINEEKCTGSIITRKVNIPYTKFKEIEENLLKNELIQAYYYDGHIFYNLTEKGKKLLNEYLKFKELMKLYGIEW
ncbi:MAG: winged helix-turn-helix domain-containing protein [Thermoplasmata archaeon]